MNIKQLESLVSIVENGGFAAAAERLHTTQSAVSARIKELEKYLGIALFDRSSHRARLTAKGEELLPYARQLVQLAQQATQRVSDPNSLSGILRIGAVGLIARRQLPRLIMEVRQRYPNVELRVEIDLARTVLEKFQDGEIDLALTTAPVKEPNVDVLPIGHDHFVWLTGPSRNVGNRVLGPAISNNGPFWGIRRSRIIFQLSMRGSPITTPSMRRSSHATTWMFWRT